MLKRLQLIIAAAAVAAGTASVVCAADGTDTGTVTLYIAEYNSDSTLRSVRMVEDYVYTTDDAVREYANLTSSQKAYVWDGEMKPITAAVKFEANPIPTEYGDNDFADEWEF